MKKERIISTTLFAVVLMLALLVISSCNTQRGHVAKIDIQPRSNYEIWVQDEVKENKYHLEKIDYKFDLIVHKDEVPFEIKIVDPQNSNTVSDTVRLYIVPDSTISKMNGKSRHTIKYDISEKVYILGPEQYSYTLREWQGVPEFQRSPSGWYVTMSKR